MYLFFFIIDFLHDQGLEEKRNFDVSGCLLFIFCVSFQYDNIIYTMMQKTDRKMGWENCGLRFAAVLAIQYYWDII